MLRKWNRILAYLLAVALIASTFHSDFATIRVYADGDENVETPADPAPTEEPVVEPTSQPEETPPETPSDPGNGNEGNGAPEDPQPNPENPEPAPENTDPEPANPEGADPLNPETPAAPVEPAIEDPEAPVDPEAIPEEKKDPEIPEEKEKEGEFISISYVAGDGGSVDPSSEKVEKDGEAKGSTASAADGYEFVNWTMDGNIVSTSNTFVPGKDQIVEGASFTANFRSLIPEEKFVTVSYSAQLGGRVTKTSETININDEDARFEGATASPVNKYYQFTAWIDGNGNPVSTESTFVPSDIYADASYTACFEKLSNMPAQDFTGSAGGMNVSVSADEGIFPEGTTMTVTAIGDDEAMAAATDALGDNVKSAKGVDITFRNAEGEDVEPANAKYVHVSISIADSLEGESFSVVHKDDNDNVSVVGSASESGAEFDANSFSVYIVAGEGQEDPEAVATRTYNFYASKSDSTPLNTQTVKEGETVYTPAIPSLTQDQEFFGWYREVGTNKIAIDFSQPATDVQPQEVFNCYADIETTYYVTMVGPDEEIVQVKKKKVKDGGDTNVTLTDVSVTPDSAEKVFKGWTTVKNKPTPDTRPIVTYVDAAVDKTVYAVIVNGHWIRFDENDGGSGGGASYTGPVAVMEGEYPIDSIPANPSRPGYEFGGWYKQANGQDGGVVESSKFNWNDYLTADVTLYAKWIASTTTNYTVVIWQQQIEDASAYDYVESHTVTGTTNATITNNMLRTYTNNPATGFQYNSDKKRIVYGSDEKPTTVIRAKGDTVVNLYFDRKTYTLTFRNKKDTSNIATITARYEENILDKFPIKSNNGTVYPGSWTVQSGSTFTQGTRVDYIEKMPGENIKFTYYGNSGSYDAVFNYYVEALSTDSVTTTVDGINFTLRNTRTLKFASYTYSTINEEFVEIEGFTRFKSDPPYDNNGHALYGGGTMNLYYKRNKHTIDFKDNYNGITSAVSGVDSRFSKVPFGESLSGYKSLAPALPDRVGCEFKGWYEDLNGNAPFNWNSTMPNANKVLYAHYEKVQYHVHLNPNGGTLTDGQIEDFDLDYGEIISKSSLDKTTKTGEELVGWFDDSTGFAYGYGAVTSNVNLTAKWRSPGTVNVKYDAGDFGSNPPVDNYDYYKNSTVIVKGAPASIAEGYTFICWKVNGVGDPLYPNNSFDIDTTIISGNEVKLIAIYEKKGAGGTSTENTTVTYVPNGGTGEAKPFTYRKNEAFNALTLADSGFSRSGYTFLGWAKSADATTAWVTEGTRIAADNLPDPDHNILYAVWKQDIKVTVTITGNTDTVTYNGSEQSVKGYSVAIAYSANGSPIESSGYSESDFTFSGEAVAKGTNKGTYPMGLAKSQFTNNNTNFAEVEFVVNDGWLKINAKTAAVTITGNKESADYDGTEHIASGYTATGDGIDQSKVVYAGDAVAKQTDVGTKAMGLSVEKFSYSDPNIEVTFTLASDGSMTIKPINVTVNIVGHHNSTAYDGQMHSVSGYEVEIQNSLYKEADFEFSGTAYAERKLQGTTNMDLAASQFTNKNSNFGIVTFNVTDGYQEITRKGSVVVTITGHHDTKVYDGQSHSVSGYDVEISSDLYKETDFTFSGDKAAERTDAGKTVMGLKPEQFTNTNDNFTDVIFNVTDGYMEITPINVTVNIIGKKGEKSYNGSEQSVTGYTVGEISSSLYKKTDFTFSGDATAKGTNKGTYPMGLSATQFTNTNPNFGTVTFAIDDGSLVITAVTATAKIIGHNNTTDYDGQLHTVTGYDVELPAGSLLKENDVKFVGTEAKAERTDAGTTKMGLTPAMFSVENANFSSVTFTVEDGYQTVNPIDVTVTIEGHKDSVTYDGNPHTVSGYDVKSISSSLYTTADFTFNGPDSITQTNAGTYPMGLAASQFTNTNSNFKTVTFSVTDGELKISPIDGVTVTIKGNTAKVDYKGTEQSVTGYDVSISNSKYTEADFTFTGPAKASGTNAGTYPMGLAKEKFANTNNNFTNVEFEVTDGSLVIEPISVTVTVVGRNDTKTYDGNSHTVSGIDYEYSNTLYKRDDFNYSGNQQATRTDEGTTYMGIDETKFTNVNDNFKNVKFNVTDGFMKIVPKGKVVVTITGKKATVDYNGTEQKVEGYTVAISDPLYKEADFSYTGEAVAKGTDAGTYDTAIDKTKFTNNNSNFKDVTFEVVQGALTINPIAMKITVTGNNDTLKYTGAEQKAQGFVATSDSTFFDQTKVKYSGTAEAKGTDVGTYNMELDVTKFSYNDPNFTGVTFAIDADGFLIIDPADVTVTITGNEASFDYNGKEQVVTGYKATTESTIYDVSKVGNTGEAKAAGTLVGDYKMNLTAGQFTNSDANFNVTFNINDGVLHIKDRADKYIIIAKTDNVIKEYTGETYTGFDYGVAGGKKVSQGQNTVARIVEFISGILSPIKASADDGTPSDKSVTIDGVQYFVSGLSVDGSGREVGTYPLHIVGTMVVKDAAGNDVSGQFTLQLDEGTLEITKRNIVVTSGSAEKTYDGTALTSSIITTDRDWATGDTVGYNITGQQIEVGSSKNTFTIVAGAGTDLDKNYNITKVEGDLKVNQNVTPPTPGGGGDPTTGGGGDPTPGGGGDPTPGGGGTPTTTDPTPATPTTPVVTILDAPTATAPTAPVAPVVDAAVLGATRQKQGGAVLGARRARTDDATNTIPRVFAIIAAAAILAALLASFRRKEEEQ